MRKKRIKSPSECDGKPIGAACSSMVVDAKSKSGRREANRRLGLVFRYDKKFSREKRESVQATLKFRKEKKRRESRERIAMRMRQGEAGAEKTLRFYISGLVKNGWSADRIAAHFALSIEEAIGLTAPTRIEIE